MNIRNAISQLWLLVEELRRDGVTNNDDYRDWAEDNEAFIADALCYQRMGQMPKANALIKPNFHPDDPLILLNYTPVAHNTLYQFPAGWTDPLRMARGTVFTRRGRLITLPFPKFFNDGEHPETSDISSETSCIAMTKHDGHLGIVYEYKGKRFVTTRGSFASSTSVLAQAMLEQYDQRIWQSLAKDDVLLVEIIHPETEVLTAYHGEESFRFLCAANRRTLKFKPYLPEEHPVIETFGYPMHEQTTVGELRRRVRDLSVKNQEGYVALLNDGRRVKFKYADYLSRMIGDKISASYVMKRLLENDLGQRLQGLDPEVQQAAFGLSDQLLAVINTATGSERIEQLLALDPSQSKNSAYKALCKRFALAHP